MTTKKLSYVIEVGPLAKKQKTCGNKGSLSKLVATPPTVLIPPFPLTPKAVDVESILFHRLGEMVTITNNDSTPSTQHPPIAPTDVPSQEELDVLLERFPILSNMSF